jgi:ankyrin repeat protein
MKETLALLAVLLLAVSASAQSLHDLAAKGSADDIRAAIQSGDPLDKPDSHGQTPLMIAARSNPDPDVIFVLVQAGAEVDSQDNHGQTALMLAAAHNTSDVVSMLVKQGATVDTQDNDGKTALMLAADASDTDAISVLLTAGANARLKSDEGKMALDYFTDSSPEDQPPKDLESATKDFSALVHDGTATEIQDALSAGAAVDNQSLLNAAQSNKHPEVISVLVKAGAKVNTNDDPGALRLAAQHNVQEVIAALIAAGAKVDDHGKDGRTALMDAALNHNEGAVAVLLKAGARVDTRDNAGGTALMLAAENYYRPELVSLLVKAGARVDLRDNDGRTALMHAARENYHDGVITDLLNGADQQKKGLISALLGSGKMIDYQDKTGRTALMIAAEHTVDERVVGVLLKAGANSVLKSQEGKTAWDYAMKNMNLWGTGPYADLRRAQLPAGGTSGENGISASNWLKHPLIVAIRGIVTEVDSAISKQVYTTTKGVQQQGSDTDKDILRQAFFDQRRHIRKFVREAGPEDARTTWTYYYDRDSHLRFAYVEAQADNGTQLQDRIYFDEDEVKIWEIQKVVDGPGADFPSEWPMSDIVFDPASQSVESW